MSFGVVHDAPGEESTAEQRAEQDALDLKKRLKVAAFFFVPLLYLAMAPALRSWEMEVLILLQGYIPRAVMML